ncbi:MAG: ABC transporter permease [Candidatus Reconcilbacillus cellulovorans]|uniref:ABC transporter permease n=1 Tax=Candidatus Reconcilbacillus cellulovorans TaxID=1906605 RepID=A0A2A6DZ49_9BACL|nr:MAG: ABC transporter permease [Candidatus Reconcilbacillus cellulovorans]
MRAYWQLTLAQLRLFVRNRQVLFWSLFFPLLFMGVFGAFMGDGGVRIEGLLVDEDRTDASKQVAEALSRYPSLKLKPASDRAEAEKAVRRGDAQLVVVVPSGYGAALEQALRGKSSGPAQLLILYDETNQNVSQLAIAAVGQAVDGISKAATGYRPAVVVRPEGVRAVRVRYIDFLVPGIVAMMIMSNNINGVAGQIASWRERGVLRRMRSTPLSAETFISAQITARLLLNGVQAVVVLLLGRLVFGTEVRGSWATVLFYVVLGTLTFMAIGFIIAGVAKTPESAGPIAGVVSLPMMFLGGVFFPVSDMPEWFQPVVNALPLAPLATALREVMNVGAGLGDTWREAALLGCWLLVSFAVAGRTFRWE